MPNDKHDQMASEPAIAMTYGMSAELRNSGLLKIIDTLSKNDRDCLVRYICNMGSGDAQYYDQLQTEESPYSIQELQTRIDEAEQGIERGEGKSFEEIMDGFREKLLWLK